MVSPDEPQLHGVQQLLQGSIGTDGLLALQHKPGHSTIHGAGIQMEEAQPPCQKAGHRAFARSRRPVNGDDGLAAQQEFVIQQTGWAHMGRHPQHGHPIQMGAGLQGEGIHQLDVVHGQPCRFQGGAHQLFQDRGAALTPMHRGLCVSQGLGQQGGLPPLRRAEAAVP